MRAGRGDVPRERNRRATGRGRGGAPGSGPALTGPGLWQAAALRVTWSRSLTLRSPSSPASQAWGSLTLLPTHPVACALRGVQSLPGREGEGAGGRAGGCVAAGPNGDRGGRWPQHRRELLTQPPVTHVAGRGPAPCPRNICWGHPAPTVAFSLAFSQPRAGCGVAGLPQGPHFGAQSLGDAGTVLVPGKACRRGLRQERPPVPLGQPGACLEEASWPSLAGLQQLPWGPGGRPHTSP